MTNVVTLPGVEIAEPTSPGEPEPGLLEVIAELEELAKKCDIRSVAWCVVSHDNRRVMNNWFIHAGQYHVLAASIGDLDLAFKLERHADTNQSDDDEG
ncbi:MAG: hypothetical protein ACXWCQ_32310 [Burkholderiales bacterium]